MHKFKYIALLLLMSCNRKTPQIIYHDKIVTSYDTISVVSKQTDTIPCDDFTYKVVENTDTVYVSVLRNQIKIKYIKQHDTVYRNVILSPASPRKVVTKIDNSVTAKKGSIIGNDNTMTTKKNNWWWIFLGGMLTWFIIQNVIWKGIKRYINLPI